MVLGEKRKSRGGTERSIKARNGRNLTVILRWEVIVQIAGRRLQGENKKMGVRKRHHVTLTTSDSASQRLLGREEERETALPGERYTKHTVYVRCR